MDHISTLLAKRKDLVENRLRVLNDPYAQHIIKMKIDLIEEEIEKYNYLTK